jgi:ribosomal protein L3 glutamine methyltransferase
MLFADFIYLDNMCHCFTMSEPMNNYTDLLTIRDYLRIATTRFNEAGLYYGHGTDNAWDEAIALVLHTLHLPHDINPAILDARLLPEERKKLSELINVRIEKKIPVPYLTHEAWFSGLPYYVDDRVLIPRSPIAELIEAQFQPWIESFDVHNILDLCTGSGCIAIACAKAFPDAAVDAIDISDDALAVAKINVLRHNVQDQVQLIKSDLFSAIPPKKYDIIVSNPPYVSTQEMFDLPTEFQHEPALALAAGSHGLDMAIQILKQAHHYLTPHGILIVEVGNSEVALSEQYPQIPFMWLEFQRGGGGVFLLTAEQLKEYVASI